MTASTGRRKTARVPLAPVTKTYSRTPSGRRVCTGATTTDNAWGMERLEDNGTTWSLFALPSRTLIGDCFGTLDDCRAYVASGDAQRDLDLIEAHARGEHRGHDPACAKCRAEADRRFARHEGVHQNGGHRRQHDPECTLCSQTHRRAA